MIRRQRRQPDWFAIRAGVGQNLVTAERRETCAVRSIVSALQTRLSGEFFQRGWIKPWNCPSGGRGKLRHRRDAGFLSFLIWPTVMLATCTKWSRSSKKLSAWDVHRP